MKKIILTTVLSFFLLLALIPNTSAQIIITNSDMPSVNDQYVVNNVTPSLSIDPVPTGANFNWDFSGLASALLQTDTFVSLLNIGSLYALAFIGSSYALSNVDDISLFGQLNLENIYDLYKNSMSKYENSGQGADINSIPTPMVFSPRDIIYKFPLNFGDADSASTDFSITIPLLGEYRKFRKRVNVVDGWGMLSLPSGNFSVLRVKSTISDRDSLAITAIPIPIVIPSTTIEYKWLGNLQGEPLLQINANQFAVTQVRYLENPVLGITEQEQLNSSISVFPSPASDMISVFYHTSDAKNSVDIFNVQGEKVNMIFSGTGNGAARHTFSVKNLQAGVYFLRIASGENIAYKKFAVSR